MNILESVTNAITGKAAPETKLDYRVRAVRAALTLAPIRDGIAADIGATDLATLAAKLARQDQLYHESNFLHTELAALGKFGEQQGRAAERAKAGEPADVEDTWASSDFVEAEEVQRDQKAAAAQAIGKEMAPLRAKVTDSFAKHLGLQIQAIESRDSAAYSQFAQNYQPSSLVIALRESGDLARASTQAFREILKAATH